MKKIIVLLIMVSVMCCFIIGCAEEEDYEKEWTKIYGKIPNKINLFIEALKKKYCNASTFTMEQEYKTYSKKNLKVVTGHVEWAKINGRNMCVTSDEKGTKWYFWGSFSNEKDGKENTMQIKFSGERVIGLCYPHGNIICRANRRIIVVIRGEKILYITAKL